MSKRLSYDEDVAVALGFEAAAAYERLRWLIEESEAKQYIGELHAGRQWVGFTYEKLRTGWLKGFKSDKVLRDTLALLERHGLLISRANGRGKWFALGDATPDSLKEPSSPTKPAEQRSPNGQSDRPISSVRVTKTAWQTDENGNSDLPDSSVAIYKELDSEDSTKNSTPDSTVGSSSSPTPPVPPVAVAVEEEKEISKSPVVLSEIEVLEKAYRDLCGIWDGSSKAEQGQIKTNLLLLLGHTPDLSPADFADFRRYYDALKTTRPKFPKPAPNFVTGGWEQFLGWQVSYLAEVVWKTLLGIERSFPLSRGDWRDLERAAAGDMHRITDSRTAYLYQKQADGTWIEIPRAEWPEWARESA